MPTPYTAEQASPAKETIVILDKSSDWDEWIFLLERQARGHDIWQYIDPALEQQPILPTKPAFPELKEVKDGATVIKDLNPD